jgi:hypothetical protein
MSDDSRYYGFTPVAMPSEISMYDDYVTPEEQSQEPQYEPTKWDDINRTNIDYMWQWIKNESDERVTATADMWRRIGTLLDNTSTHLRRFADALDKKWNSDASKVFMMEIGKSLYSIDEWKGIAQTNAAGLDVLAGSIRRNQEKVKPIWLSYVSAINNPGSVPGSAPKTTGGGKYATSETETNRKTRLQKDYTEKVKPFVKDLANTYMDVYFYHLSRGGKFKGPTDAVFPTPPTPPSGKLPPGVLPTPIMPKPNLPKPELPKQNLPDPNLMSISGSVPTANLPGVDGHSLTLAGQMGTMPQVDLPNVPNLPTVSAPPPPNLPPMPVLPSLPKVGERPPVGGEPEALASSEPSMTRPPMPGRPNLSGLRKPGQVRPPSPGRGRPNLRGAKDRAGAQGEASDLSEEVEHPNAHGPMSPRLGGRRDGGSSGRTGAGSDEESPGRGSGLRSRAGEEADRLAGRRRPGAPDEEQDAFREQAGGRPDLEGRSAARRDPSLGEPEEAGHSPALGGRGAQPPKPRRSDGVGRQDADDVVPEPDGEERLWEVDQVAPTVIDTPHAPRRSDPGPALGRPD